MLDIGITLDRSMFQKDQEIRDFSTQIASEVIDVLESAGFDRTKLESETYLHVSFFGPFDTTINRVIVKIAVPPNWSQHKALDPVSSLLDQLRITISSLIPGDNLECKHSTVVYTPLKQNQVRSGRSVNRS